MQTKITSSLVGLLIVMATLVSNVACTKLSSDPSGVDDDLLSEDERADRARRRSDAGPRPYPDAGFTHTYDATTNYPEPDPYRTDAGTIDFPEPDAYRTDAGTIDFPEPDPWPAPDAGITDFPEPDPWRPIPSDAGPRQYPDASRTPPVPQSNDAGPRNPYDARAAWH